jgi:hypothetical protein
LNRAGDVDRVAEVTVAVVLAEIVGGEWRLMKRVLAIERRNG